MIKDPAKIWQDETARQLADALLSIESPEAMCNFLRDVMTEKEIIEISARLKAARMLKDGQKYTDIVASTRLSSRTVARISDWMKNGCGGYAVVINQTGHHGHGLPERVG